MGYIAQRVELTPILPLRAADVVAMGLERGLSFLRPFGGKARRAHVRETLQQVDALDLADRPFGQLSEGQKQRVLIARLLVGHPHIAVLDEPTAAMDRVAEQETLDLIGRLCAQHHMAVLIVSHQLRTVTNIADHVFFVDRASQTVIQGPADQVLAQDLFRAHYGLLHPEGR
jgi:zinc transport system ATP-binding protein